MRSIAGLLLPLFGSLGLATAEEVVARAGGVEIKEAEIRVALSSMNESERAAVAKDAALLSQLVRSLLVQRVVLKEANEAKWQDQPEVAAQLQRVRDSELTRSFLQAKATVDPGYPDETELHRAYDLAKPKLLVPKQYRLAQIFIAAGKDGAKAELESVRKQLRDPKADFAAMARAHSEDVATAAKGGELGWMAETKLQPEIRAVVGKLAKSAISETIELPDGWHVVKVLETKAAGTATLEEVRAQLVQQLRAQKAREASHAYLGELMKEQPVALDEIAISKIATEAKP